MKKISLFIVLGIVLLLLSGCFQSHRIIYLNKDGSGKIVETMLITSNLNDYMGDEVASYDVEELEEKAADFGEGVKYVSSKDVTQNSLQGYEVTYSFQDISKIRLNQNATQEINDASASIDSYNYITFRFKKGGIAELKVIFPKEEKDDQELTDDEELGDEENYNDDMTEEDDNSALQMVKTVYADMEISTKIVVEGKIVSSDATHVQDNEITLEEIIFAKLLENENALKLMDKNSDVGDIKFINQFKDYPGVKIEQKNEITIKFK
ncbi:MAG: hypothetical protein Q7J16_12710 [Candidatus Cloacimonadales bacterium]|nr:hypothetical protein [Candidatus Cloacimonadales bacterium]